MVNISELFGYGKSTLIRVVNKFINVFYIHFHNHIQWPTNQMALECVKVYFYLKQGFPNCCGAIDVTHFKFHLPPNECSSYWYGRDHNYSMSLQEIIYSNMYFMDVFIGWPSSIHDCRLLQYSCFYRMCEGG